MLVSALLAAMAVAQAEVPPVPGLCSAPVPANRETPGCYQTGTIELTDSPTEIYWHIQEHTTEAEAIAEAKKHRWSIVTKAHSRIWLYVLGAASEHMEGGVEKASIGPLQVPPGAVTAHFSEAIFPPGMQTRVHSHPGPEAFYVVEGEQCMETPTVRRLISAGGTHVVPSGAHIQAAPKGRRNLVLILAPQGVPFVIPGSDWYPTGFCNRR